MTLKFEVGHRYLADDDIGLPNALQDIHEIKVVEVSPSGKRMKVEYSSGCVDWVVVKDWEIVEELQ